MRLRLVLLTGLLLNFALAQTCYPELRGAFADAGLEQVASGGDAAHLLREAVDLLEPVLPPLVNVNAFGLQPGSEVYDDATYADADFLAQRGLLPAEWQAASLTQETWQAMVDGLAAWYDLEPFTVGLDLTRGALTETLSTLIGAASPRLNPVALVATDPANRDRIAFWAVIRSDSVYPRLIAYRPPETGVSLAGGVGAVLPQLETCALRLDNYVSASATTAQKLFLATQPGADVHGDDRAPERVRLCRGAGGRGNRLPHVPKRRARALHELYRLVRRAERRSRRAAALAAPGAH